MERSESLEAGQMKAGVIGLGRIGSGISRCLARAGLLQAVYDIDAARADDLGLGIDNASSPHIVGDRCDVVLLAVFDAKQARAVLLGDTGLLAGRAKAATLVLLSTVSLPEYFELRVLAAAGGAELLDCGVTGGSAAATNGLVSLVGGPVTAVEHVRPILDGYSKSVYHMGGPGAGLAAKLARNVIVYGTWRAEHEGFALAKAAGVDPQALLSALEDCAESMAAPLLWPRRDSEFGREAIDDSRREHSQATLEKDLAAATDLAASVGLSLPAAELARATAQEIVGLQDRRPGQPVQS